jgi:hypothetical protein
MDTRIARWWSIDPVTQPHQSPYNLMDGNPILLSDPKGDCPICPFIAAGLAGAAVDLMFQASVNLLTGKDITDINWTSVGLSGAAGMASFGASLWINTIKYLPKVKAALNMATDVSLDLGQQLVLNEGSISIEQSLMNAAVVGSARPYIDDFIESKATKGLDDKIAAADKSIDELKEKIAVAKNERADGDLNIVESKKMLQKEAGQQKEVSNQIQSKEILITEKNNIKIETSTYSGALGSGSVGKTATTMLKGEKDSAKSKNYQTEFLKNTTIIIPQKRTVE